MDDSGKVSQITNSSYDAENKVLRFSTNHFSVYGVGYTAPAVKQMQMAGILNGKDDNKFDPTGTATRGEISAMLHRYVEWHP